MLACCHADARRAFFLASLLFFLIRLLGLPPTAPPCFTHGGAVGELGLSPNEEKVCFPFLPLFRDDSCR